MAWGRRSALGGLFGALTAGPAAVKSAIGPAAEALSKPLMPLSALVGELSETEAAVQAAEDHAEKVLWRKAAGPIRELLRVADARNDMMRSAIRSARDYARSGFEPDIAANRSWSHAYKWHVQHQRCLEREEREQAFRDYLYGPES